MNICIYCLSVVGVSVWGSCIDSGQSAIIVCILIIIICMGLFGSNVGHIAVRLF